MPRVGSSRISTCGSHRQPLAEHDLLLVAAREVHDAAGGCSASWCAGASPRPAATRLLGCRGRASPSGRSCRCRAARCSGRPTSAAPGRGACGPRAPGRRRASMASRGRRGAYGLPSSVIVPPRARASTPKIVSISSVRPAPTSPANPRISPRRAREADAGRRARDDQVLHLEHDARRAGGARASAGSSAPQSSRPTIMATILSCVAVGARAGRRRSAPSRRTVMRSASCSTSSMRCEM